MKSLIIMGENLDQIMDSYKTIKRIQCERDKGVRHADDTHDIAVFDMHKALMNAIEQVNEKPATPNHSSDFEDGEEGGIITFD